MLSKHRLIGPLLYIELKQKKGHYFSNNMCVLWPFPVFIDLE